MMESWTEDMQRYMEKKRAPDKHGGKGQPPLQVMPCSGEEEEQKEVRKVAFRLEDKEETERGGERVVTH